MGHPRGYTLSWNRDNNSGQTETPIVVFLEPWKQLSLRPIDTGSELPAPRGESYAIPKNNLQKNLFPVGEELPPF